MNKTQLVMLQIGVLLARGICESLLAIATPDMNQKAQLMRTARGRLNIAEDFLDSILQDEGR